MTWTGVICYFESGEFDSRSAKRMPTGTLRVLRPLKSLKMLPGMKMLINSMLYAIGPLANVVYIVDCCFRHLWDIGHPKNFSWEQVIISAGWQSFQ